MNKVLKHHSDKLFNHFTVITKAKVRIMPMEESKMTEEKLLKRIAINPKIMLGKPVIKGTRLPVEIIVEKIAFGATIASLKKDYPFLTKDDVKAALLYAAKRLAHEEVYAA